MMKFSIPGLNYDMQTYDYHSSACPVTAFALSHIGICKQVWNQNTDDACALDEKPPSRHDDPNTMKSVRHEMVWFLYYTLYILLFLTFSCVFELNFCAKPQLWKLKLLSISADFSSTDLHSCAYNLASNFMKMENLAITEKKGSL